jgi:hypothetical protein
MAIKAHLGQGELGFLIQIITRQIKENLKGSFIPPLSEILGSDI